jgi:radical SAM superfamily enzyme YgiQ (UPF0313 family)
MSYKICIINPKTKGVIDLLEPLGLMSLATYLKQRGIQAKIIDEIAGQDVFKEIESFKPNLVGFTAVTCTYPRAVELMQKIKTLGYRTVVGGVHVCSFPEQALRDGFDMVVVGEGERMLFEIITKGHQRGVFRVSREMLLEENEFPIVDRSLVDMNFYFDMAGKVTNVTNKRTAFIMTSRGCPFQCIFCNNIWQKLPMRFTPPEKIIEEIDSLVHDYQVQHVGLGGNDFFLNKEKAHAFCKLMHKRGATVTWSTSARTDSLDEETISLAACAGCTMIGFGFESGSQRILDILNKKLTVQTNFEIAKLCHKHNIEVAGLIMVGNPTETMDDIRLTWDFIKKVHVDTLRITVATPLPGTTLWQLCKERGYIPENVDFSRFYVTRGFIQIPDTFSPKQAENIKKKLLLKAHLFNPKLRKKLIMRFCHDPFCLMKLVLKNIPRI